MTTHDATIRDPRRPSCLACLEQGFPLDRVPQAVDGSDFCTAHGGLVPNVRRKDTPMAHLDHVSLSAWLRTEAASNMVAAASSLRCDELARAQLMVATDLESNVKLPEDHSEARERAGTDDVNAGQQPERATIGPERVPGKGALPLRRFDEPGPGGMTEHEIRRAFAYHDLNVQQRETVDFVRARITNMTVTISHLLPNCRERAAFLMRMQDAMMWANAAVSIHDEPE